MSTFSPSAIFERGRQEAAANQPRFLARVCEMIVAGLAVCMDGETEPHWFALAPWSRVEPGVFLAYDLALDGEAGLHRVEFDEVILSPLCNEDWGHFSVKGRPVASFRPLGEAEDQELVDLWNTRSGRPPVKLVEL
jgi:hypothetical protein